MFAELEDIVETLTRALDRGKKCSILIGAGCSVTAGIPTAQGFVEIIKREYPRAYKKATTKTYPDCMAALSEDEQRDLIARYVDTAKISWAYIALAQLIKNGFVDRVLTTNFDPLVIRACALAGIFPATYDLAASLHFEPNKVPDKAVFYLHGQRTGFVIINTPDAYQYHSKNLGPVFEDAGRGRVWLVIGYSGQSDPVFEHLSKTQKFDNKLYWIGYNDNEPSQILREKLLLNGKDAYYVKGYDADKFLITLTQKLGCFPPDYVSKPFSYLDNVFELITPYPVPKTDIPINVVENARKFLKKAINTYEVAQADVLDAWSNVLRRDFTKVIALEKKYAKDYSDVAEPLEWAYILQGIDFSEQAQSELPETKNLLLEKASNSFASAVRINSSSVSALYNWGSALAAQAETKDDSTADELFKQAGEKFKSALMIDPRRHDALNNWGAALSAQAKTKVGIEADRLYELAIEKFAAALNIKGDKFQTFINWGSALGDQAKKKTSEEANRLLELAKEKLNLALTIKPDSYDALYNLGVVLTNQARIKPDKEAKELLKSAIEKFDAALIISLSHHISLLGKANAYADLARLLVGDEAESCFAVADSQYFTASHFLPNNFDLLNNWGSLLIDYARTGFVDDIDSLFEKAQEKLAAALKIKPDYYGAYLNWGLALDLQAQKRNNETAEQLYKLAEEKFISALKINPKFYEAYAAWGNLLANQANSKKGDEADRYFELAKEKYAEVLNINPNYYKTLHKWGLVLLMQARNGKEEGVILYNQESIEKLQAALKIKPDDFEILDDLGLALSDQARLKTGNEADRLFELAKEKFHTSLAIKPNRPSTLNNLGATLLYQSRIKEGREKAKFLLQAKDILLKSEDVLFGSGAYNLACVFSILGNVEESQKWLLVSKDRKFLPSREILESDSDLDFIRNQSWFKNLLD